MSFKHIPERYREGAENAASAISGLGDVLLAAHVNLDGDAYGSLCASGHILKTLGARFFIYSSTGVPAYMSFLEAPGPVYENLGDIPTEPASAVYLDCSEFFRLGRHLERIATKWPSVNIDHHMSPGGLGSLANFVEAEAAATAQLVAYVALALDIPLKGALAESVALGLLTDTGGFCHGNTTADVFSLCALLERNGCRIPSLREKTHNNWPLGRLHLWGRMLSRAFLAHNGKICCCAARLKDFGESGCSAEDVEGLVEWLRKVHNVEVALFLREEKQDLCKFSLRSFGDTDVREMAAELGGGGHRNAAGGMIKRGVEGAMAELLRVIGGKLDEKAL